MKIRTPRISGTELSKIAKLVTEGVSPSKAQTLAMIDEIRRLREVKSDNSQEPQVAKNIVLQSGWAECLLEPRGESGLEGYVRGQEYLFAYMSADKAGKPYFRVWPEGAAFPSGYYETCSPSTFNRFFKEKRGLHDQ